MDLWMNKDLEILLVDQDNKRNREISSRFRTQGYGVTITSGGFHALHELENVRNPHEVFGVVLIIGDQDDMPGYEIANHVNLICQKIPVVYGGVNLSEDDKLRMSGRNIDFVFDWDDSGFSTVLKIMKNI